MAGNKKRPENDDVVPGFDDEVDRSFAVRLQTTDRQAECLVLYLDGKYGHDGTQLFQRRVAKAIERGYVQLVLDLRGLDFRWSGDDDLREAITDFIGTLVAFIKAVKPRGGDVVLTAIPPAFREMLSLLGFGDLFTTRDNPEDGVAFFAGFEH